MCDVASQIKGNTIVEIGRHYGGSTVLLALVSKAVVWSVDYDDKFEPITNLLCWAFKVDDRVKIINDTSSHFVSSWTQKIDLLFIDGDHNEKSVYDDLINWIPFVKKTGFILIHDYFTPESSAEGKDYSDQEETGPYQAIQSYLASVSSLNYEKQVDRMALFTHIHERNKNVS